MMSQKRRMFFDNNYQMSEPDRSKDFLECDSAHLISQTEFMNSNCLPFEESSQLLVLLERTTHLINYKSCKRKSKRNQDISFNYLSPYSVNTMKISFKNQNFIGQETSSFS